MSAKKPSPYSEPMSLEVERGVYQHLLMRIEEQEKKCRDLMDEALLAGDERTATEMQLCLNEIKRMRENLRKPGEPRR
jgi:hypothetical protein